MMTLIILIATTAVLTAVIGVLQSSLSERWIHKFLMHRALWIITHPHYALEVIHHGLFKADESFELQNHAPEKIKHDRTKIRMAWWNFLIIVPVGSIPYACVAAPFAFFGLWAVALTIYITGTCVALAYYFVYEYIHWCMHLPRGRQLELWPIFQWLLRHHRIHHLLFNKNLNVVLPFADWLFGSLYIENPTLAASRAFRGAAAQRAR